MTTFAGTALVVLHDRWFLDRVATHIIAFEGDSNVEWFEGNYSDCTKRTVRSAWAMLHHSGAVQANPSVKRGFLRYSVDTTSRAAARVLTP